MAKLFYTLEEAAGKLSMSAGDVQKLVSSGQLQEFRDREKLMFKVDQVDLLASGHDDEHIPLVDSGDLGSVSLVSDSGTGLSLESPKEQSGISIFDADEFEGGDASEQTQITETATANFAPVDTANAGSGLMDMTREADDTSLGADLLEDVYSDPAAAGGGPLFETSGADAEPSAVMMPAALAVEPYDHMGSCAFGGMALGAVLVLAALMLVVVGGLFGGGGEIIGMISGNYMMFAGGAGGVVVLFAIIGAVIGMITK